MVYVVEMQILIVMMEKIKYHQMDKKIIGWLGGVVEFAGEIINIKPSQGDDAMYRPNFFYNAFINQSFNPGEIS